MGESGGVAPRRAPFGLLGLLLLAAALRLWRLEQAGLWLDESMSWWFARADWPGLLAGLRHDSGPPGYYLLLKMWTALWGDSEIALRSLSAVLGAALVPVLFFVGRWMVGERAAWLAAGFAAISPLAVYFGREARGYCLLALLSLGAVYGVWRWLEEGRWSGYGLGVGALTAALYTHYFAMFLALSLGSGGLVTAAFRRDTRRLLRLAGLTATVALLFAPWVPELFRQVVTQSPVAWMGRVWQTYGVLGSLGASLSVLSPGGVMPGYLGLVGLSTPWSAASALVCLALLAWGLRSLAVPGDSGGRVASLWLAFALFGPLLIGLLYSSLSRPIYLPGRIDQVVLPAFCLVLGRGLAVLPRRIFPAVVLALVSLSLAALAAYFGSPSKKGERELASRINELARPGDFVVTTSLTGAPLAYYLRQREIAWRAYPSELSRHPGNEDLASFEVQGPALEVEARSLVAEWERQGARGFVVLVPSSVNARLFSAVRSSSSLAEAAVEEGYEQRLLVQPVTLLRLSWLKPDAP